MIDAHDAIVRVALSSICTSDLHIKHGSVPSAVPGITVGHEMVGIVEEVGEKHSPQKVSTFTVTLSPGFTWVTFSPTWWMGAGMQN